MVRHQDEPTTCPKEDMMARMNTMTALPASAASAMTLSMTAKPSFLQKRVQDTDIAQHGENHGISPIGRLGEVLTYLNSAWCPESNWEREIVT